MPGVARKRSFFRYWLRGGDQRCLCCGMVHSHTVTVRCAGCDRGFCGLCVVTVGSERFCPDCKPQKGRR